MSIPPCQTIYVSNLNEKINKDELRRALYALYSEYGRIMDVVALKTKHMRGQAHVVYSRVSYAKSKSHAVMKEDGTFGKAMREKKREAKKSSGDPAKPAALDGPAVTHTNDAAPMEEVEEEDDTAMNSILYITNLPGETTTSMLEELFGQLDGLKEVRQVGGRPDIAFIEYNNEDQAAAAKDTLQSFKLTPQHPMHIVYAKK